MVQCMSDFLRKKLSFNQGWLFEPGDRSGGADPALDDSSWRMLSVPHDWGVEHEVMETNTTGAGGGFANAGVGWYRKHFNFSEDMKGRRVSLLFDGVYMDSTVYLNGKPVGGCGYGYSSFSVDLTDGLVEGENVVAVRVDNSHQPNSRWYTGSGIYRNVWLNMHENVHMDEWGVFCFTNTLSPEINHAGLHIKARIVNDSGAPVHVGVLHRLLDSEGNQVSFSAAPLFLAPGECGETMVSPGVKEPHLWTDTDPYLYTLESTVVVDNVPVDVVTAKVGIRTATFDCDRGFLLNGKSVKIKGMCVHQDCGLTGAAFRREIWERRLRLLKEMSCNGIRCAHNPPDPQFLDLCDELGFLVMDEAFDEWLLTKDKNRNYYSETFAYGSSQFFDLHGGEELTAMLRRDRNHPSVILWSIGNEVPEQSSADGVRILKFLRDICHREDPSRMVTAACDNIASAAPATALRAFENELDVVGYNYTARWRERAETLYDEDRKLFPARRFCGTENISVGGFRGVYSQAEIMPDYLRRRSYTTATLQNEWLWRYTASRDFVAGDYLWTGVDYLGETPWPCRGAASGPIDTAGFPKDGYYYFRSIWNTEELTLHLVPHWNWEGEEGVFKQVVAYTSCDEVKLCLNGRLVGTKGYCCPNRGCVKAWNDFPDVNPTTHDLHLVWDVPYEPGVLKAVGYKNKKAVMETVLKTTGKPVALKAAADRETVSVGGLAHIEVSATDAGGLAVPDAAAMVHCEVFGPARLLGMDSGDLMDHTLYGSPVRKMYSGLLLTIVEAFEPGDIRVKFSAEGMKDVSVILKAL
jgi:beta-galactosidase